MAERNRHKYSTVALVVFIGIVIIGAISAFTSQDLDQICDQNDKILQRIGGTWVCSSTTINTTLQNITPNSIQCPTGQYLMNTSIDETGDLGGVCMSITGFETTLTKTTCTSEQYSRWNGSGFYCYNDQTGNSTTQTNITPNSIQCPIGQYLTNTSIDQTGNLSGICNTPSGNTWGDITGNINTQTDLINIIQSIGNWSTDKTNYYNKTETNSTIDYKIIGYVLRNSSGEGDYTIRRNDNMTFDVVGSGTSVETNYQTIVSSESGLLLYWKMDSSWVDSKDSQDGTAYGGATFDTVTYKHGNASGTFDGSGDYVAMSDYDISGNKLTVEAWIKTGSSMPQYTCIVCKTYNAAAFYLGADYTANTNKVAFIMNSETGKQVLSDSALNDNVWHHLVGVYDGDLASDNVKLYIDGVLQTQTQNITGNIPNTIDIIAIGSQVRDNPTTHGFDFAGIIDEAAIYTTALTSTQIISHNNSYKTVASSSSTNLFVKNSVSNYVNLKVDGNINATNITVSNVLSDNIYESGVSLQKYNDTNNILWTNSSTAIYPKDLTKNVGIGVNNPVNSLDVKGGVVIGTSYAGVQTSPSNGLLVQGNVGIGLVSVNEKLGINGSLRIYNNGGGSLLFANSSTGYVGIRINNPSYLLDINGSLYARPDISLVSNLSSNYFDGITMIIPNGKLAYYTSNNNDSIGIMDISDLSNPKVLTTYYNTTYTNSPQSLILQDNYLLVTFAGLNSLVTFDVSNYSAIKPVSITTSATQLDNLRALYLSGNILFGASRDDDLITAIDINNPLSPVILSSTTSDSTDLNDPYVMDMQGKYLYVGVRLNSTGANENTTNTGFTIYDVSNPYNMTKVAVYRNPKLNDVRGIDVEDNLIYLTSYNNDGLMVINITDFNNMQNISFITSNTTLDGASALNIRGRYAYIPCQIDKMVSVYDISNPLNPTFTTSYASPGTELSGLNRITIRGSHIFASANTGDQFTILKIGSEINALKADSLEASTLDVNENARINKNLYVKESITVGNKIATNTLITNNLSVQTINSTTIYVGNITYTDTYWEDIATPATSFGFGTAAPSMTAWNNTLIEIPCFSGTGVTPNDYVSGTFEMPHSWKEGSEIEFHIHSAKSTNNAGNYTFKFDYLIMNVSGGYSKYNQTNTTIINGAQWVDYLNDLTPTNVDMTGFATGTQVIFRLTRTQDATTDNYGDCVGVKQVSAHYQSDSPGSRDEYTK